MSEPTTTTSLTLQENLKLRGEKNYATWKPAMIDLADANDLKRYISSNAKIKMPKEVDEDSDDTAAYEV